MASRKKSTTNARAELQAWYLQGLLPQLSRAAGSGVVEPRAVDALDAQMRSFLQLPVAREDAS
jgi:hypothetical protein